jgi:hypothetical protein
MNASCIVNENIRDKRDDKYEMDHANEPINDLVGKIPPCSRDIAAYSSIGFELKHKDPLDRNFLSERTEEIPPYTVMPAPYRWLREENFQDICEAEGLSIRGPENGDKEVGWVYEPDRQIDLLDHFWGKVKEGKGEALIFYYVKDNPVDEDSPRLIVGVGRLKDVGPQLYFEGTDDEGRLYPIWTRVVTQDYPSQGFRLPYQEYLDKGEDPRSIACHVPPGSILQFSFVGEHISDDQAVGVLESLIQSVETVRKEAIIPGPWTKHLKWLNDCLSEVWLGRGPYPGIGSALQYLGMARGTTFQRLELKNFVKENRNPWAYVKAILEGSENPPVEYNEAFQQALLRWRSLKRRPNRLKLLGTLTRFELTPDQIKRVMDRHERKEAGIGGSDKDLIDNPYLICEQDLGTSESDPVALDTIDRGMFPQGDAALFIPREKIVVQDDTRRVRAVAVDVLNQAADDGDTLLSLRELLSKIRERFPDRRACRPDGEIFISEQDFHRYHLWLSLDGDQKIAGLTYLRELESFITETIKRRVKRKNKLPSTPIEWQEALTEKFGEPITERKQRAFAEQENALNTLFTQRVSVLTGSAGTGKTSVLSVFLKKLEEIEGKAPVRLLAPTGKARVRLSSTTKRNAFTIHQLLYKLDWFLPDLFVLKPEGGGQVGPSTVIIDECSMVPVDLLGTLFKALNMGLVRRLILVGDPNQLPPIGPGRPFVDITSWLDKEHPQCVARLRTTMRVSEESDIEEGKSIALAFADGYRGDMINPADDEILSNIARGINQADLAAYFWEDQQELEEKILECLQSLLSIGDEGDYQSFNSSLGIQARPDKQSDWKDAERWQVLSPLRTKGFGTTELNRMIQFRYRRGLIETALRRRKTPRPFGEQQIVWTDKVIQNINKRRTAWPRNKGLDYVANGEIGIVTTTYSNQYGDYLQVGFSTQDGVTYRYYRGDASNELELAYALTVHKAQGSDFEIVFLIIPKEAQTLSRELIYTGLTRFRKRLVLLIQEDTQTLQQLRLPENSATHLRNTFMFSLAMREDEGIPYPEYLIHRTSNGTLVRSKSEVIVADTLTRLGIDWEYEKKLISPHDPQNFRLPDFTIGFAGDIAYWEHLGMLTIPDYREKWKRKRKWYQETMGIPVVGDGIDDDLQVEPGEFPVVITSRDGEDGSIDSKRIEQLIRKYILLEE